MKSYLLFAFLLCCSVINAQKNRHLSVDLFRSFHGTGDMRGVGFGVEYGHFLTKRFEVSGGLAAQIHHAQDQLLLNTGGDPIDASYRMVTGGIQVYGLASFAPLRNRHHELKAGIGPLIRYQSSSASGGYGTSILPNYPEPVYTFRQVEDQNIVTAGFTTALSYNYTFEKDISIGAKAAFQTDTNGDVLTQYGLRIGKRF